MLGFRREALAKVSAVEEVLSRQRSECSGTSPQSQIGPKGSEEVGVRCHQLGTMARWLSLTAMVSAEAVVLSRQLESYLDSPAEIDWEPLRAEVRQ